MRLPAAERRRQLLEIATDVFASRGYHDSSMNDIADAAGVTKPVLYQHFDSKRELYLELLRDIGEDLQLQISKATADAGGPRQQIQNGFGAYFEWMSTHPAAFRLLQLNDANSWPSASSALPSPPAETSPKRQSISTPPNWPTR